MARYEVTGGNGRGASAEQVAAALKAAGADNVRLRNAYGMSNQPKVATFSAPSESSAKILCENACDILWPGDTSIMANLIAYEYE